MSGKGKRKGTGKSKFEERETKLDRKRIDVVCLAYDIFKYSASKFGVDANCLAAWEGPKNDYGEPPLHFIYICRTVILDQLRCRCTFNHWFKRRVKNEKLESFEPVCQVLESIIEFLTPNPIPTKIKLVEMTLAVACELILFLHAKGKGLYLKQLAERWFECYFRKVKKKFEKEGGLDAVCWRGYLHVCECPHAFIDLCITNYKYNDYEEFVKDEVLLFKFHHSAENQRKKNRRYKCPEPPFARIPTVEKIVFQPVSTSKREEASGDSLTPNPALGVPLPQEMYDFSLADDEALSKNLPEASVQEPSKHAKKSSHRERRNWKSSSRPSVEQGHGQPSSDSSTAAIVEPPLTSVQDEDEDEDSGINLLLNPGLGVTLPNEMYDFRWAGAAPLSQNFPEESVQELSKRPKRPSYHDRIRNRRPSSRSSVEQGHGQLSSDSSLATGSKQFYERQGVRPKEQNTGSSGFQTGKFSSRSSVEQGHRQLSSDSSLATGSKQSYERQGVRPKEQNTGSSGFQTGKSSSRSSGKQSLGQLSSDSSIDTTQSYELQEAKTKVRVQNTGSYGVQTYGSSLCSIVEQDFGQLSLDSSGTKLHRKKKAISSMAKYLTQSAPDEIRQERTRKDRGSSNEEEI